MTDPRPPTPDTHVTLTINGRAVSVPAGTLLVEAAKTVGIEIPIFCYHPKLKPVGACRMCLVEIEKMPRLQTACTTPVSEGMVVSTNNEPVVAAQNGVIEMLLANHPLDCPICDKGGECPLQDNAFGYGLGTSRFTEQRRHLDKAFPLSDRIVLDKERCIMCLRCVRFQREIPGDETLTIVERAGQSEVGTLPGESFDSPFSGNTIELCPVGALTSRQYRFRARPWDLQRTPSICVGCGVGCNVELHARDGKILRIVSRENPQVDDGWLCDYGRFDTLGAYQRDRTTEPLVRENGELRSATWDEALARAAEVLSEGESGALASPALSDEAYRVLAGSFLPQLSGERSGEPGRPVAALRPQAVGAWPFEGKIADLAGCRSLLLVGLDPWQELPVLTLWLRKAVERGGRLVAIGPANGLFRDTAHWLKTETGEETATAAALLRCLAGEGGDADSGAEAAARALGEGPSAVLAGPRVARSAGDRAILEELAQRLGADPARGGVRGCPSLTANGRGALEAAPQLTQAPASEVLGRAVAGELGSLLLVGSESWPETGAARLVQLTSGPMHQVAQAAGPRAGEPPAPPGQVATHPHLEVVLPITHLYEQAGLVTNLEGRVQELRPGGFPPRHARPDWEALLALAEALQAEASKERPGSSRKVHA